MEFRVIYVRIIITIEIDEIPNITNNLNIIKTHLISNKKYDTEGNFLKWKSRLVAGGDQQIFEGDTKSPTIGFSSLLLALNYSINNNMEMSTIDIRGAYLNAQLDDDVYVKLSLTVSKHLCKIDQRFKRF